MNMHQQARQEPNFPMAEQEGKSAKRKPAKSAACK